MCDVLTGLAVAATVAGTAVSAFSNYQQQRAQNQAAEYNARIMERNAQVANMQADQVIKQGEIEEKQHRLKVKNLIGAQRAAAAGSGFVVDEGSFLDNMQDTAGFGELDALTIKSNAARSAWGIRNQATDYTAQANLSRMRKGSPVMAAGTSLLTGASQLGSQLYQFNRGAK